MIQKILKIIFGILLLSQISCNKDEGTGGEGSIKGVVVSTDFDLVNKTFLNTSPATDLDIFINYGDDLAVGDRVRTSSKGSFEFKYLRDGNYKIYAYSDDTASLNKRKMVVEKNITIKNGNAIYLDTLFIFNALDFNDGGSIISGKVYINEYDRIFGNILSTYLAYDRDVFLSHGSQLNEIERTRTGADGTFEFRNLIKGNYKIYAYSDDTASLNKRKMVVEKNITIKNGNAIYLDTLFIFNALDFNDGGSIISGKVYINEYDRIFGNILSTYLAYDRDVFLSHGSQLNEIERTRTGADGTFEFRNLIKGNYKVYVLSEDSLIDNPIIQSVIVDGNSKLTLEPFYAKKGLDIDDGKASIKGRVWVSNFKQDGITLSGEYWGQDVDVYLIYGNKTSFDIRVRTSYDGTFEFTNLIKGNYKIFVYTAQRNAGGVLVVGSNEDDIIFRDVIINTELQEVDLGQINTEKL